MFEAAVSSMASNVKGGEAVIPHAFPLRTFEQPIEREQVERTRQTAEETRQSEESREVTQKMLDELEQDLESIHSIGLTFARHNDTGRTMIKVMDKQNHELIREIPAEEVLNLAARIEEMIGILFDQKV